MNHFVFSFLLLPLALCLSSCIEFEEEELVYNHDVKKDEIRMTLRYQGIFGNLARGINTQKNPNDKATADKLNQKQIEDLASVLNGGRAFFFTNWIFEYDRRALSHILKEAKYEPAPEGEVFGKPEKNLIEALMKDVEIENVGFYKDEKGHLCGAQTLKLSNASTVISLANHVITRQMRAKLPDLRKELEENRDKEFSRESLDLMEGKLKGDFPFIQVEGNLIILQLPMVRSDAQRISEDLLKDLPKGARIEFRNEALMIKIGGKEDDHGRLWMKCFDGYLPNALNHVQENHQKLLLKPKKVNQKLRKFLEGQE